MYCFKHHLRQGIVICDPGFYRTQKVTSEASNFFKRAK